MAELAGRNTSARSPVNAPDPSGTLGSAVVIVNPHHGDYSDDGGPLTQMLKDEFSHLRDTA